MRKKPFRILGIVVAIAVIATACASARAPEVTLEARWLCDVQRQTFDDLAAIDAELDNRLVKAGLTRADYEDFKERLSASADLREQVSEEYDAYCLS
jgi:hypothetical protein